VRIEQVLLSHCRRQPEKLALVFGEERVSYRELGQRIRALAAGLAAQGLKPGDRAVLYMPNSTEFVEAFFGVLAAGGIPIPVTARLTTREVRYFCEDSGARLLVCHADQAAAVREVVQETIEGLAVHVTGGPVPGMPSFEALRGNPETPLPVLSTDQDEAAILYTSGTTGRPKGVLLTHANILIQHGYMNAVEWGISGDDRYLVAAPMAHRAGMGRMINSMMLGGTLFVVGQFVPETVMDIIEREQITVFGMVPTMCRMLLPALEAEPHRAASLRRLAVTGEAFPVALKMRMIELLPQMLLVSFFGMTEAGGVTTLLHDEQFEHADSVGRPSAGVEVRIVDEDGRHVETGGIGELLVRSGRPGAFTIMKGYFARPEESAQALRDGWFHTGDMAREDEDGYLYIVDRKKDMILSGGFNIYSKEVELTIAELHGVGDVAVVGVPDPVFGEAVVAIIEPASGTTPPDEAAVVDHCKASIAGYKKPKHVLYRDALPRNATGKVLKRELAAEVARQLGVDAAGAAA
jgi:acyl-CoA synthetase (AMP-forming)/AMP-acid ligase II